MKNRREQITIESYNIQHEEASMRKAAFTLMLVALVAFIAAPAVMACGSSCGGKKTASKAADKAGCELWKGTATTAAASDKDNVEIVKTGAACGSSVSADKSGCGAKSAVTTATATLPNGHPAIPVSEAVKCEQAMVVFMNVDKMHCGECVKSITKAVGSLDGICAVDVSLEKASAAVVFHPAKAKTDEVISAITKAGYVASLKVDCAEDMKEVFGADMDFEKCSKVCANFPACAPKQEGKASSEI